MRALTGVSIVSLAAVLLGPEPPPAPALTPPALKDSDLTVRVERVGRMPTNANPTSPAVAGLQLLLIDQAGYLYRWDGAATHEILGPTTMPPEITPTGPETIL